MPAREAGHQGVALVGQVDQLEHLLADLLPRGPLDPVGRGEELEVLDHLHVVVDAEEVGHVADDAADLLRAGVDRVAADGRLAPGGIQERGQDPHRRRLARAVGADEAVDVPLVERQVEPVQGVQLAVHLGQFMRLDHRTGLAVGCLPCQFSGPAAGLSLSGRITRSIVVSTVFGVRLVRLSTRRECGRSVRATSIGRPRASWPVRVEVMERDRSTSRRWWRLGDRLSWNIAAITARSGRLIPVAGPGSVPVEPSDRLLQLSREESVLRQLTRIVAFGAIVPRR